MILIKEALETCAAGIGFKSAYNCKLLAKLLLFHCSNANIDAHNEHFFHLQSCIKQCEFLSASPIWSNTYKGILQNLLIHWDILGNWTWTYRALLDIIEMDIVLKNYGL